MKDIIIQGDCLSVLKGLPSELVDLGITSPPYNKGNKQKGWLVKDVKYDSVRDDLPEDIYQQNQIDVLDELYRVTKEGGSFFYNHKLRWNKGVMLHPYSWLSKTKWTIRQEIIWDRSIAANIRGYRFWQVEERIFWLYKPKDNNKIGSELLSKHSLLTSIWRFSPERNNPHPAPFPIELPSRIIHSLLDDREGLVIDPYAGSGTTLVASKLLGKNYLGIEVSSDYSKMAEDRLNNSDKELDRVNGELVKHFVNKTFKERKAEGKYVGKFSPKVEHKVN